MGGKGSGSGGRRAGAGRPKSSYVLDRAMMCRLQIQLGLRRTDLEQRRADALRDAATSDEEYAATWRDVMAHLDAELLETRDLLQQVTSIL